MYASMEVSIFYVKLSQFSLGVFHLRKPKGEQLSPSLRIKLVKENLIKFHKSQETELACRVTN